MDPRRLEAIQRRARSNAEAQQHHMAESSESEFESVMRNRAAASPVSPATAAAQAAARPAALSARASRDQQNGMQRAVWAALLQAPLLGLIALFSNDLETLGYQGLAWPPTLVAIFSGLAIIAGSAEVAVASKIPLAVILFLQGMVSGALYPLVEDSTVVRGATMALIGCLAGNLRFLWNTRRLSRRMPHTMGARMANFIRRATGLMPAFVVGETVACAFVTPDGWVILSRSWGGYVLVMLFPYLLVTLSTGVAWVVTRLFGGDREHVIGRKDVTKMQLLRWIGCLGISLVLLVGTVGYLFLYFGGVIWTYQLLMSPYGIVVDIVTYKSLKDKERRAPQQLISGREAYKTYTRRHAKLISEVMGRKQDFHTH
jgi:hypothetical protein